VDQRLGKQYKLCSKKIIEELFKNGERFYSFPYSVLYNFVDLPTKKVAFQVVFAVSKRSIKLAHDRNKIKRQMREALRKHKCFIENALPASYAKENRSQLALFILYNQRESLPFDQLMDRTKKLTKKLNDKLNEKRILPPKNSEQ